MQWLLTVVTGVGLLALFALGERLRRRGVAAERTRQLVHVLGASTAAAFPLYLSLGSVLALSMAFTAVLSLTAAAGSLTSVHAVARHTAGAYLFPLGLGSAALLTWSHPAAYSLGALVLALADPAASLAGSGRRAVTWPVPGGRKSLRGSLAFFLVALMLTLIFTAAHRTFHPFAAAIVALVLTVLEASLGYGLDNLPLPPATALLGVALLGL